MTQEPGTGKLSITRVAPLQSGQQVWSDPVGSTLRGRFSGKDLWAASLPFALQAAEARQSSVRHGLSRVLQA
jgi:hypothetical protein